MQQSGLNKDPPWPAPIAGLAVGLSGCRVQGRYEILCFDPTWVQILVGLICRPCIYYIDLFSEIAYAKHLQDKC